MSGLVVGADGVTRCAWAGSTPEYLEYHDAEWGVPVHDDRRWFEFLLLEGAQAGLSWDTILRKRDAYRAAFAGFDPEKVAAYRAGDVKRLLADEGIVRNRLKVESAVTNAQMFLAVQKEFGSLAAYIWTFEPTPEPAPTIGGSLPAQTPASAALSKDLRKRGFSFVGPTTVYAFMQAMGLVNDHYAHCDCRKICESERTKLKRPK